MIKEIAVGLLSIILYFIVTFLLGIIPYKLIFKEY